VDHVIHLANVARSRTWACDRIRAYGHQLRKLPDPRRRNRAAA
jgi:hypothetical protein